MNDNYNIDIPAISYTNKDFRSIYPEMLDLAKQLTNKWDPSRSNESDPGVVLLKEAAFVADHNNYNIDKNILENFLPTATQDISVRNITEMNGYTPRYYVSANGNVSLKWNRSEGISKNAFTIPAFTIILSDAEDTVSYTQISDIVVTVDNTTTGLFLEGTLQQLSINDTSTIHLDNLDDNNRIYFPESLVAQNGVFVRNTNSDDYNELWVRDNYLLTQPTGSHVYKIDYDSNKDLPYIEFPSDISNLIGDGLEIQYISTSGEFGNVSANTLTKIISPSEIKLDNGEIINVNDFIVWNPGSITNGKNPETINEMYQSFRKVVGTFDTLVTCLDYSNKIYTLTDAYDNPYVSNVYVTDRRSDYNKSMNIVSYDINSGNTYFENVSIKPCSLKFMGTTSSLPAAANQGDMYYVENDGLYINIGTTGVVWREAKDGIINYNDFALLTSAMTPYDLVIYALTVFSLADYSALNPFNAYNNSFKPVSANTLRIIKSEIEEEKCICHTYKSNASDEIFCFKNYAPLNVEIYLYNKIKENVKDEILNNIYKALSENFNPRNLEFGKKLNTESIKKIIIESDSRIRDASVSIESSRLAGMRPDGTEVPVVSSSSTALLTDLIAKNTLAGRICLFNFNDDFNYDFGQINGQINSGSTIETESQIVINDSKDTTKYYTAEVKRTATTMTSSGDIYKKPAYVYTFNAPNFINSSGTRLNLSVGSSYVLTNSKLGEDILTIIPVDTTTGKPIKDDAVEYKSNVDTSYIITNQLNNIINNNTSSTTVTLPAGELTIYEDKTKISQQEGILNLDYTLNENEAVQIIHPNYFSESTYTTYVNYRYIGTTQNRIYANTEHTLKAGEKIILLYTQDSETQQVILEEGQIVRTSFNLIPTDELSATGVKKDWVDPRTGTLYENANFRQLTSNQTISVRKPMNTILNSSGIWCYWIINSNADGSNRLFETGESTRILRSDEYFIYTNSALDEMMILGAGTMLTRTDSDDALWDVDKALLEISSLSTNGTASSIPWVKNIDFVTYKFTITEMNVITLGEGDRITIFDWTDMSEQEKIDNVDKYVINNNLQYCNGSIRYTITGSETVLPSIEKFYLIRSRLDLNCSKDIPQRLYTTANSTQKISINETTIESNIDDPTYIQPSRIISAFGDTINLGEEKVNIYSYNLDGKTYDRTIVVGDEGYSQTYPFFYRSLNGTYMIPIHISGDATDITISTSKGLLKDFNNNSIEPSQSLVLEGDSSYYIQPVYSSSESGEMLELTISYPAGEYTTNESIVIGDIVIIENGINKELNTGNLITLDDVLNAISSLIANSDTPSIKPYYPYKLDNSIAMNNLDFEDANSVWDTNNIINPMTIAQIDFNNSNFIIPKNMIVQDLFSNEV